MSPLVKVAIANSLCSVYTLLVWICVCGCVCVGVSLCLYVCGVYVWCVCENVCV